MSFEYKLDKVNKLGEYDTTYGQAYWCSSTDEELPLKLNSHNQDIMAGDTITAEETVNKRTTPKPGKEAVDYLQLKKVQVVASIQEKPSHKPDTPQNDFGDITAQLQRIEDGINQLLGL